MKLSYDNIEHGLTDENINWQNSLNVHEQILEVNSAWMCGYYSAVLKSDLSSPLD